MTLRTALITATAGLAFACGAAAADAPGREQARLLTATQVLEELRASRDQAIPDRLLERAYGIAVIPDMTKIAWFLGGRRGHGVLLVRDKDGRFTSPVFITMTGGSFGFQWGVQLTDVVLVFTTARGVEGINGGKVTLGGDAAVAAGPVGRQASAGTDATFKAEVYSYSRNRGAFVGLALDGSVISIDDRADGNFYGKPGVAAADILSGGVRSNDDAARRFLAAVSTSTEAQQRQASAAPTPAPAVPRTAQAPAPSQSGAQTFPLSDQHPGSEPK